MASRNTHEDFARQERVEIGSNRTFGVVIGLIAMFFGVVPLVHDGQLRLWLLMPGAVLLLVGALKPGLLSPLNLVWFWIGKLLGMVVAPIVMMMIFLRPSRQSDSSCAGRARTASDFGAAARWRLIGSSERVQDPTRESLKNQF